MGMDLSLKNVLNWPRVTDSCELLAPIVQLTLPNHLYRDRDYVKFTLGLSRAHLDHIIATRKRGDRDIVHAEIDTTAKQQVKYIWYRQDGEELEQTMEVYAGFIFRIEDFEPRCIEMRAHRMMLYREVFPFVLADVAVDQKVQEFGKVSTMFLE
jgi:hypothetical protein